MFVNDTDLNWGAWVLGDAPHVLDMACAHVGHGAEIVSASVRLPREDHALPRVTLVLPGERSLAQLRESLLEDGLALAPDPVEDSSESERGGGWRVELPGIELRVSLMGKASC